MTQPTYYSPPVPPQPPPGPPPFQGTAKRKRFGWLALILATVAALLVGSAIGMVSNPAPTTARPAPTATVTRTVPAEYPGEGEGTEAPDPEPEPEPTEGPAAYEPKKSDWQVKVKITDKQCYGSAGCNVEFKIHPQYIGTQDLPDSGAIEVTYEITGDEDPIIGTFTVTEGDQVEFDEEGSMSTPRSSTKVKATITDVSYDENG